MTSLHQTSSFFLPSKFFPLFHTPPSIAILFIQNSNPQSAAPTTPPATDESRHRSPMPTHCSSPDSSNSALFSISPGSAFSSVLPRSRTSTEDSFISDTSRSSAGGSSPLPDIGGVSFADEGAGEEEEKESFCLPPLLRPRLQSIGNLWGMLLAKKDEKGTDGGKVI